MIGVVQSGYGAAQRDVANGVYAELGDLYPGSLNLRIERGALTEWGEPDKVIDGPECELWLWRAEAWRPDDQVCVAVWLMHPHRWPPIECAEVVEVFAWVHLRSRFNVNDGDAIRVAEAEVDS